MPTLPRAHLVVLSVTLLLETLLLACEPAGLPVETPSVTGAPAAGELADPGPAPEVAPASAPPVVDGDVAGHVTIDGSSTVFPITEAVVMALRQSAPRIEVHLGVSGTGGGFKKFCRGELDVADASRPIKLAESELCRRHGVELIEVPIAFDGLSVVVHPDNGWAACMTVEELRRLWRPEAEGRLGRWSEIRPGWPDEPIALYAPGRDSGTFDYFTSAVVGVEGASRSDFTGSEDDYLLAQDVSRRRTALGFFGYAYYCEYQDRLRLVAIDAGNGCVAPTESTITDGSYQPLSRPLFLYVARAALARDEVRTFVDFYLANAGRLVRQVRYVPLPPRAYELAARRVAELRTGSVFSGGSQVGVSIEQILELETPAAAVSDR